MATKFNFQRACDEMLKGLGAMPPSDAEPFHWLLQTSGGQMKCHVFSDWLACRFEDVAAAKNAIHSGSLNPYSGKWNWHFVKPTQEDVEALRVEIQSIL